MNKRGLTIVELLAVLVVIGLIAVVIFPVVTSNINDSKDKTMKMQKASIKEAAESYVAENIGKKVFLGENSVEEISLNTLINEGFLTGSYKDPIEGKEYDLINSKVIVTKENSSYTYSVELNKK